MPACGIPPVWCVLLHSAFFILHSTVVALAELPPPTNHVEDRAGVMTRDARQRLNAMLKELEDKTTAQMIVLVIDSTGGVPIDQFSLETATRWKLGRRDRDNGVLVTIAIRDRKYWIEVGYGLEAVLTDQFCGQIGRESFQRHFRRGDYTTGIVEGVSALIARVAAESGVTIEGAAAPAGAGRVRSRPRGDPTAAVGGAESGTACCAGAIPLLFLAVMVLVMVAGRSTRRRRNWGGGMPPWWVWILLSQAGRGSRRGGRSSGWGSGGFGGWGGGGWGGGGFGGGSFGGGGGGSFGGGGRGGGW